VKKLLMTGDNSTKHYDPPTAMGKYAIAQGVPAKDVIPDYPGFDTYDIYASHVLHATGRLTLRRTGISMSAILNQSFLPATSDHLTDE